jgi:hypothetical protein
VRLSPAIVMIGAATSAVVLIAFAPMAYAHLRTECGTASSSPCPTPTPTPSPTPIPVNAFLSLDVTSGDVNTAITVNGSAFLPNQSTSLYWDQPNKIAGASNADANGNFTTRVKPFATDAPGVHRLCASVLPNPCASFTLLAAATSPTPSPSPSPSSSASPTDSASPDTSPTPVAATISGFDVLTKPPFVILPIIGGLGIAIALGYWILSLVMRPKEQVLKSVAVAHLATRPDYSAGFGAAPAAPAPPPPTPSAWDDVPAQPPPSTAPEAEPPQSGPSAWADVAPAQPEPSAWADVAPAQSEPPPPAAEPELPEIPASPDEPPDLPEPGEY